MALALVEISTLDHFVVAGANVTGVAERDPDGHRIALTEVLRIGAGGA